MTGWAITDKDVEPTDRVSGWITDKEPAGSWWRPTFSTRQIGLRDALQAREQITLLETEDEDISVLPGKRATAETLERQRILERMHHLIDRFATEGFGWDAESACTITPDTARAAKMFLDLIPHAAMLPRIAPDGDGGLTVVWERNGNHDLLVIEDWTIHIVRNAATNHAQYEDNIRFDGQRLPDPVKPLIRT